MVKGDASYQKKSKIGTLPQENKKAPHLPQRRSDEMSAKVKLANMAVFPLKLEGGKWNAGMTYKQALVLALASNPAMIILSKEAGVP